ncbi:hypothetical protein NEPAR04_1297 [Nematocida parisii]|nr:hypothetical protein NEPAR08_1476 [Nematocida parisii]KAI5129121.1 hypothetical protein NEPAR03_1525 [Nematocida parisii]KAI5141929.1 hypothetical protein NEPAR04_1297 [Nematocida parisii]
MEHIYKEKYKMFTTLLALANGVDCGKNKISSLLIRWNRDACMSSLFQAKRYDELYSCVFNQLKSGSNFYKRILAGIAGCIQNKDIKSAFIIARENITDKAPYPCIILSMIIEGHMYLNENNIYKAKPWVEKALECLEKQFSYGLFILIYTVQKEVLFEEEEGALFKSLSVINLNNPKYFEVIEDIKDIKKLEEFLASKNLLHSTLRRLYILKNPLLNKKDLLKYFEEVPKDKECLKYVLERRICKELIPLAEKLGIFCGDVKDKQEEKQWMAPFRALPAEKTQSKATIRKIQQMSRKKLAKVIYKSGLYNKVRIPASFGIPHDFSEEDDDEQEDEEMVLNEYYEDVLLDNLPQPESTLRVPVEQYEELPVDNKDDVHLEDNELNTHSSRASPINGSIEKSTQDISEKESIKNPEDASNAKQDNYKECLDHLDSDSLDLDTDK